jgi:hypothetical protein
MSVARAITGAHIELKWLRITDEDGGLWYYSLRGIAQEGADCQIGPLSDGRVGLIRDEAGKPVLRQDEPGLPKKLVAALPRQPRGSASHGVESVVASLMEYERE